jgi:hypothetical protein
MTNHRGNALDELERWTLSGGHWRLVDISSERAVVDLCACTWEPMERLESDDPVLIAHLRSAHSDLDLDRTRTQP